MTGDALHPLALKAALHIEFSIGLKSNYYPFKKYVESEIFFFSVCCRSVMSLKPLFERSQLQLSSKFTTVGI